ncbi:hypothetical protein B4926_18435 [Vibrio cholerae]|uniref:fibronectin type III domain-containing protein n=1 Tax=Vibrio cholerae TaxID=666 RepID=UPI0011D942BF|nr:chitinase N-terminal domain-containing protein [Vibrio cholerae]EGR2449294.1 hypothetical protein [Vibrio cholerae]EGR4283528.1 hypothetical protein [Vibrio cholerae]ELJ8671509.1 hypothetical protein [Vibrio cholerae]MCD1224173.1 hypothetical protein [Vibrio cholerae]MCD1253402.1 hypothetical protein [Vibrio cholerae]
MLQPILIAKPKNLLSLLCASVLLTGCLSDKSSEFGVEVTPSQPDNSTNDGTDDAPPTIIEPTIPAYPSSINATSGGRQSITVSWSLVDGANEYKLKRDGQLIAENLTQNHYTDTGLNESTSYKYSVQACNEQGCSADSKQAQISTLDGDNIYFELKGLDPSTGSSVGINAYTQYPNGGVLLDNYYSLDSNQRHFYGKTFNSGRYGGNIRYQPDNGQTCTSSHTGYGNYSGGQERTVTINCLTPAKITLDNTEATVWLGFPSSKPITVTLTDASGKRIISNAFHYSIENPELADIDENTGYINAKKVGTTRVIVTAPKEYYGEEAQASYNLKIEANKTNYQIDKTEVGQVLLQESETTYQRLIAGRDVLVRAYLSSSEDNIKAPNLTLKAQNKDISFETIMTCPTELPTSAHSVPAYTNESVCYASISGENVKQLIQPGLKITIEDKQSNAAVHLTPHVNQNSSVNVVIVPLKYPNEVEPVVPTSNDVEKQIRRTLPFNDINVKIRSPYTVPQGTPKTLEALLGQVAQVRKSDQVNNAHYYGMAPGWYNGTLGVAYIGALDGVGIDVNGRQDQALNNTFVHEFGHNLSLGHASCGTPATDNFWNQSPEAWPGASKGKNSIVPIYDQQNNKLYSPTEQGNATTYDVMGYCGGKWTSEYSFAKASRYIESKSIYTSSLSNRHILDSVETQTVTGIIHHNGTVELSPVEVTMGFDNQVHGKYKLHVYTADGNVFIFPFGLIELDHGSEQHFSVSFQKIENITNIEVFDPSGYLIRKSKSPKFVNPKAISKNRSSIPYRVEISGLDAEIQWDNKSYPWISLVHISPDNERTTLQLGESGGYTKVQLPDNYVGKLEIILNDGFNQKLFYFDL